MHLRLPLIAAVLLSGCATAPTKPAAPAPLYSPPTSGPTARLLLRVINPGGRYTISTYAQPVSCSQRQEVVSTTVKEPERTSMTLAANRLQTISFMQQPNERTACQVIFSFEPRAGKTYLMRGASDVQGCSIELYDATNPDRPVAETTRMHRERIGYGQNDNACKAITSTAAPRPSSAPGSAQPARGEDALAPFRDLLPGR